MPTAQLYLGPAAALASAASRYEVADGLAILGDGELELDKGTLLEYVSWLDHLARTQLVRGLLGSRGEVEDHAARHTNGHLGLAPPMG